MERITKSQLSEIEDMTIFGIADYHAKLKEVTGITAVPYTGYSYYDDAGNYIGDSVDCDLLDLLKAAYIEVTDNE